MTQLNRFIQTCVVILLLITTISFLGGFWWVFDLFAHARVQYLLCASLGFITLLSIMFLKRHSNRNSNSNSNSNSKRFLILCFILIVINSYPIFSFIFDTSHALQLVNTTSSLRVMSLNVMAKNTAHTKVIDEIKRENPDVVLLIEVNERWVEQLSTIEVTYPHQIIMPREDNFGIALYSKRPFSSQSTNEWGDYRIPYITASVNDTNGKPLHITGIHTMPPLTEEAAKENYKQSQYTIKKTSQKKGGVIIMGDWNNTPWSQSYQHLMSQSMLSNSASGSFPGSSWNTSSLGGLLIDHIMVKNVMTENWHTGQDVGSDHRAVIVDVLVI